MTNKPGFETPGFNTFNELANINKQEVQQSPTNTKFSYLKYENKSLKTEQGGNFSRARSLQESLHAVTEYIKQNPTDTTARSEAAAICAKLQGRLSKKPTGLLNKILSLFPHTKEIRGVAKELNSLSKEIRLSEKLSSLDNDTKSKIQAQITAFDAAQTGAVEGSEEGRLVAKQQILNLLNDAKVPQNLLPNVNDLDFMTRIRPYFPNNQ